MKLKLIAANAIVAAIYVVLTLIVQPIAFYALQFRISEMLNHLVVFNKKYFFGIVCGVFIANLFSPLMAFDLVFGTGQSILSLLITIICTKLVKSIKWRMVINVASFTFMMWIIALELQLAGIAGKVPFMVNWLTIAAGEFIVLVIGALIFYAVNKRINLAKLI
ncbi:QueT transporter family protein [Sporolactobacillus vineae]|uniref:QueT transporter family protein n=1 Tax=Sporolactobacillus vineae TaxID=444463 RepID=UPI000289AF2B|nr:QueT transporter family protein [Sporolactobacillus vineae]